MKQKYSMSPLINKYYKNWIIGPTLLGHQNDLDRFYKFIKACIRYRRKHIDGQWLKHFLERDLKNKLTNSEFQRICSEAISIFDHIVAFHDVFIPDHLIEMRNPNSVAFALRNFQNEDETRQYSEEEIRKILNDNFQ